MSSYPNKYFELMRVRNTTYASQVHEHYMIYRRTFPETVCTATCPIPGNDKTLIFVIDAIRNTAETLHFSVVVYCNNPKFPSNG